MKRKRVFSTCGCVLAMGMAISAVSAQAAVYSSIQSSVTKPQTQVGDGLFDYCSDEVKEFAKNFNKDEVFSLAYRQDGETRIDVATFDADEIQAFFDAMSSIKVKNVTTERSSDCDDIFYFTFADASAYRISFNGHHLEANGLCYEISGDEELWKLGIYAKTKHNEVAPAQHEVACVYAKVNITTDNNHLLMQIAQDIAKKHGLRCLLHEKPFAGVNGSGKHDNWSVITNTGINLFNPGKNPEENKPFLAALACTIKAVDEYAEILRMSIASAGNDHRLGANEAPPAIISMFLGEELDKVVEDICTGKKSDHEELGRFDTGVSVVPTFSKDNTDRNRTSPFAFTGNKFEFRAVGSAQSVAGPNTILNSMLAEEMTQMADAIEGGKSFEEVVKEFISEHKRIIFNGDGYSAEWEEEAKRRGLPNHKNTVDALKCLKDPKYIDMLDRQGVYTKVEIASRYEILLDNYIKTIQVEALTAVKMVKTQIYPAACDYLAKVSSEVVAAKEAGIPAAFLTEDATKLATLLQETKDKLTTLENNIAKAQASEEEIFEVATMWRDDVFGMMQSLRETVDTIEELVDDSYWPIPTYVDLLFGI